jgi:hypothetical protein
MIRSSVAAVTIFKSKTQVRCQQNLTTDSSAYGHGSPSYHRSSAMTSHNWSRSELIDSGYEGTTTIASETGNSIIRNDGCLGSKRKCNRLGQVSEECEVENQNMAANSTLSEISAGQCCMSLFIARIDFLISISGHLTLRAANKQRCLAQYIL